jgi:hypothetical protein
MKKVINLHKQQFGGHKEALELELEVPVRIRMSTSFLMRSLNTSSERFRNEKMIRKLVPTDEKPEYKVNPGDKMFYIQKENTKIFFRLNDKDLMWG